MHANENINSELLDNEAMFQNEFFQRFELRHREAPLALNDTVSKNYRFPTFYGDASCAMAIFHCDYDAAKAIMPDPSMEPVKMTKGRALVIFSCYEYRNVMNVAPYNEIAMTIPVVVDGATNLPVLTMLLGDKLSNFGYHVFHMPVTSLENRIRGRKIWGLPKDLETIEISNNGTTSLVKASVPGQAPYLELEIPVHGSTQNFDVSSNLYSVLDGDRLKSETHFKSDFSVTKNIATLFRKSELCGNTTNNPVIKLGQGPMADKLRALKIESEAFQFRYTPSMNACFDIPKEIVTNLK